MACIIEKYNSVSTISLLSYLKPLSVHTVVNKEEIYRHVDRFTDRVTLCKYVDTDATFQFDRFDVRLHTIRSSIPRWRQLDLFGSFGQRLVEFKCVINQWIESEFNIIFCSVNNSDDGSSDKSAPNIVNLSNTPTFFVKKMYDGPPFFSLTGDHKGMISYYLNRKFMRCFVILIHNITRCTSISSNISSKRWRNLGKKTAKWAAAWNLTLVPKFVEIIRRGLCCDVFSLLRECSWIRIKYILI